MEKATVLLEVDFAELRSRPCAICGHAFSEHFQFPEDSTVRANWCPNKITHGFRSTVHTRPKREIRNEGSIGRSSGTIPRSR